MIAKYSSMNSNSFVTQYVCKYFNSLFLMILSNFSGKYSLYVYIEQIK